MPMRQALDADEVVAHFFLGWPDVDVDPQVVVRGCADAVVHNDSKILAGYQPVAW